MRQLQLPLWKVLEEAAQSPETAELDQLWREVEASIVDLECAGQLQVAGEAISQITAVFAARSQRAFEEILATASQDGPIMSEAAFDQYVRQTMQIEFDEYIEPLDRLPRKSISISENESQSIVAEVEPARLIEALHEVMQVVDPEVAYEQALALAHEEDVSQWGAAIQAWLSQRDQAVPLVRLQRSIKMPLVQVWLALLLNGFAIQQRGEFYDLEQVWILQSSSPSETRALESS
ncbi:hypothetical protein NIES2104_64520 [Leptolyngbya sp. NIES-2104]|nr:hypothetical protein NIES2104_64520 [Leptolyngbya sp. NIES-2104]